MSDNKDMIKQLSTREQCRDKLPIFYGSRDNFIHGLKEVLANAIDEVSNNFENGNIEVTLFDDLRTISVKDTGRGVPINKGTEGVPNYVLLFERLFSGTNFDNNENGKITTGVNGSGTCVLNNTSELFKVESARDGHLYELLYTDGGNFNHFKELGRTDEHYSIFTFKLDKEVYTNVKYDYDEIKDICKHCSTTNNKVTITLSHKGDSIRYHYDSIKDYFDEVTANLTSTPVLFNEVKYDVENEINIYNGVLATSSDTIQETYLNSNFLPYGGTINEGIIEGVRRFINKYCKDSNSKFKNLTTKDVEDSFSFVFSVQSTNVEYENQIKLSTRKKTYRTLAQKYVQDTLEVFEMENKKEFQKMVNHVLEVQKFNNKSQASKDALKKKLAEKVDNINNRVEGLVDCKIHGDGAELYITEGRSALGGMVLARDPYNQAGMPIRGKILNCLKANYDKIFKNDIVTDLVKVLGCGIETDKKNKDLGSFDINNLRYHKIIFLCDEDPDARAIVNLLLTMFYRLMPTLIKQGKIFIAQTPLFEIRNKDTDEMIYAYSEQQKEEIIKKIPRYHIARNKGVGEVEPEVLSETAMKPTTRKLIQVKIEDVLSMVDSFDMWMDDDVTRRKAYIENHLNEYIIED